MKRTRELLFLALWLFASDHINAEPLHLLGIGNSFTENMLQFLPFLLPDRGSGELDVAYLFRPGKVVVSVRYLYLT